MGLEKQGAKPSGILGLVVGRLMNKVHTSLYMQYFKNNPPAHNSIILDIGCGGGKFIHFLSKFDNSLQLYGLDHSDEMIFLSKKTNKKAIGNKQVKILKGSVINIPVESSAVNLVTAFETIQFWPHIPSAFKEVARVLKKGGEFIIINRFPPEGSKWWKIANLKSAKEYSLMLEQTDFTNISFDLTYKKGWIIAKGYKL
ncbi:MAG: class I SAM-dependent methyltransferase [Bacteroidales bacterium]|nr:class I SAM-dependent methyltransferase [Bacteroidales bacterium]